MSTAAQPIETAPVPAPRNRLGLAALILGIVALVLAFVPFASYGAWLVGIVAVVLGIVSIVRPGTRKRAGVTGIVLGAIAVVASVVMSIVYTVLFALAASTAAPGYAPQSAGAPVGGSGTAHRIVYSVSGKGRATAIAYFTVSGGQSGQTNLQNQALPWSKSVTARGDLSRSSSVLAVVAQNAGTGTITCSISLDGKVVVENSAKGESSAAQCTYRPTD